MKTALRIHKTLSSFLFKDDFRVHSPWPRLSITSGAHFSLTKRNSISQIHQLWFSFYFSISKSVPIVDSGAIERVERKVWHNNKKKNLDSSKNRRSTNFICKFVFATTSKRPSRSPPAPPCSSSNVFIVSSTISTSGQGALSLSLSQRVKVRPCRARADADEAGEFPSAKVAEAAATGEDEDEGAATLPTTPTPAAAAAAADDDDEAAAAPPRSFGLVQTRCVDWNGRAG